MITLDPFYSVPEYIDALEAMDFNGVQYREYIDIRTKLWYIDIDNAVTHKALKCKNTHLLAAKVLPVIAADEPNLKRRPGDTSLARYLVNDCMHEFMSANVDSVYAFLANANDAAALSTTTGQKIWWFGRYGAGGTGACVCEMMPPKVYRSIMVPVAAGIFDTEINARLFNHQYYLRKYSRQPYFHAGKFYGYAGSKPGDY